jgi:hypothetical protein
MKIRMVALASALAIAGSGYAIAQQDLHAMVKSIITETADDNEKLVGSLRSGELEEGESDDFSIRIDPGQEYAIYSSCDFDCYDLDLAIVDDDGNEIDFDYEDDDVPIVIVEPGESGDTLNIRIDMEGCDEDVCVWAVGVYEQS